MLPCVGARSLPLRLRCLRAESLDGRGGVLRPPTGPFGCPAGLSDPPHPEYFSRGWPAADSCHTVRGPVSSPLSQRAGCCLSLPATHCPLQVRESFPWPPPHPCTLPPMLALTPTPSPETWPIFRTQLRSHLLGRTPDCLQLSHTLATPKCLSGSPGAMGWEQGAPWHLAGVGPHGHLLNGQEMGPMWESFAPRSPGAALGEVGSGARGGGGGVCSGEGSGQRLRLLMASTVGQPRPCPQPRAAISANPLPSEALQPQLWGAYDFSKP